MFTYLYEHGRILFKKRGTLCISLEVKEQALLLLKEYPIKEVAAKIGISVPTLYNWKREYEKTISKSISQMIIDLEYDKAIETAKRFPNCESIQSQLITIYIKQGEYDKAIEIAKRFPKNKFIQNQLGRIYKKVKSLKNNLNINPIEDETILKKINRIRSKLLLGTVQLEDINYLDSFKTEIDLEKYSLIKAAIYERLNLKNNCVAIIRQIPNMDIRQKRKLIEEVLKKQKYYNIQKWDELIKWEIDDIESYFENKNQIVGMEQKR